VFTSALVEGLATGEADRDEDGWVSLNELYSYVFDKVREQNPHQTPSRQVELEGELYVARSRRRRIRPAPLPPDLQEALAHPNMYTRLGAISELRARLASDNLPAAAGAYEALAELTRTDIRYIADPAAAALQEAALHPEETQLDFGQIEQGSASPHRTVRLLGPPIARACVPHPSDAWIRVTETAGGFDVSVDTSRTGTLHGTLDLKGPTGEATITIYADLVSPLPQASHIPNSGKPEVSSPPHGSPAAESGRPASPGVMAPPSDARIRQRGRASPQGVQSASVLAERYQQALRHMEAGEWQEALTQLTAIQGADSGYKDTGQLAVRARRELAGSSTGDAQPIPLRPKSLKEIRLPKRVNAVVFSPDSTCLAIASGQMAVMVDLTGKEQLRVRHPGLVASIQDVAFDSTGHWLATAGHNEALIWDVATGKRALQVTHQSVRGVSFNPVSAAFATWGADRVVRIWDATTSSKLGSAVADRAINGMVFSRDGRRFATGAGRYAQIWDTATGRQGLQLSHPGRVERVAFSPDGRWLATTARDGGARVWDAATGDQRLRIAADEQMNRVTFSPDGRWLATAGGLGAASIFHTATGDRLSRIPPSIQGYEYDTMHEVVFSPDGTFIAISVNEGRIDLWQVTGEQ
jgi:hypothetical protein